jgi:exodeoxyribonuclease-5
MKWSPQQDAALRDVDRWLCDAPSGVFRLFGFAGTGKTTLAKHLAEHSSGKVAFAAYTGKAASVMRKKGCADASTIHRLIYKPVKVVDPCPAHPDMEQETDQCSACGKDLVTRFNFVLNQDSPLRNTDLLIVDECSMVNEEIGRDLLSFGTPVLVLGDPEQLPPPNGAGFFTDDEPDVMLTEIQRQARENPIIAMATIVREGGRLALSRYGDSRVVVKSAVSDHEIDTADQVLIGTNGLRCFLNSKMCRSYQTNFFAGYCKSTSEPLPLKGDKVVCLRNNHAKGLLNGGLWIVEEVSKGENPDDDDEFRLRVAPEEGGDIVPVTTHALYFNGNDHSQLYTSWAAYDQFDFGYALTVHKAQGSQWDNVMLLDQSDVFGMARNRWLYTGITRAAERITVVVNDK